MGFVPCRYDETAWFGVTQSAQIGFFSLEYVEEVMNDNVDGKYYSVTTPALSKVSERKRLKSLPL